MTHPMRTGGVPGRSVGACCLPGWVAVSVGHGWQAAGCSIGDRAHGLALDEANHQEKPPKCHYAGEAAVVA
jgi:hypothetical protein